MSGGNDRTTDIPNRDAAEYRIDEANLFLTQRYQGKDYILPGTHALTIGIALRRRMTIVLAMSPDLLASAGGYPASNQPD